METAAASTVLDQEQYEKLKRQFPELQEASVKEALLLASNNLELARATLQNRYYGDENAIEKEVSIWSALFGDTSTPINGGSSSAAQRQDDDWGIDALANGFVQFGNSLMEGLDQVADAVGNLGDLIPELIFGEEYYEDEYDGEGGRRTRKEGEVVVGGKRQLKKRGGGGMGGHAEGTKVLGSLDELSDESGDDWTKED